jgi:1-aminocyclopropane-1-carboxylate deaminase/D-cysteine desulfhydrase-like pyridoxal-dependent ACC family enzyme
LIRSGRFDPHESVVFIHTGGWPGLFAYRSEVAESLI